eukprot:5437331-Ditylum_brightwellii.AAC.1
MSIINIKASTKDKKLNPTSGEIETPQKNLSSTKFIPAPGEIESPQKLSPIFQAILLALEEDRKVPSTNNPDEGYVTWEFFADNPMELSSRLVAVTAVFKNCSNKPDMYYYDNDNDSYCRLFNWSDKNKLLMRPST